MAYYVGFSTKDACKPRSTNVINETGIAGSTQSFGNGKKFKLTDEQLVIQDFINALNIRKGSKTGQPGYGTNLWDFIFEPNTLDVKYEIESEIRRVANLDTRLVLNRVTSTQYEHGILVEIEVAVTPFNNALMQAIFFDNATNVASSV